MRRRLFDPGAFEPEAIAAMSEAYDAACNDLGEAGQSEAVRERLARRILAAARLGERDPARLRAAALAAARGENEYLCTEALTGPSGLPRTSVSRTLERTADVGPTPSCCVVPQVVRPLGSRSTSFEHRAVHLPASYVKRPCNTFGAGTPLAVHWPYTALDFSAVSV
jgi:hypothetical protein